MRSSRRLTHHAASPSLVLPVIRLPSAILPGTPVSLPVAESCSEERPPPGSITPAVAGAISGGRVALFSDGARSGVVCDVLTVGGGLAHVVGSAQRVALLEPLQRTSEGARLARFAALEDDAVEDARSLEGEHASARALLEAHVRTPAPDWDLLLCTLDEELTVLPPGADPASHPRWVECAAVPEDAVGLTWWLASRLPLATALRHHLLECGCPLKRLRDTVDAMRLLANPAAEYARLRHCGSGAKLRLVWNTAEASGCELEPPTPVVDWAHGGSMGVSRY